MTDHRAALEDVAALIEERERYTAWLAALEARREGTPGHVYERVRSDYRTRLDGVTERLSAHRDALAEELAGLDARLSALAAQELARRDERAEIDLRAHVGELGESDAAAALRSADETLSKLASEKAELRVEIDRVTGFVAAASAPARDESPASATDAAAAPASDAAEPAPVSAPLPAMAEAPKRASVGATVSSLQEAAPVVAEVPGAEPPKVSAAVAASTEKPAAKGTKPVETGSAPAKSAKPAEDAAPPAKAPSGSFDELGFLSSVIGNPAPTAAPEPAKPERRDVKDQAPQTGQRQTQPRELVRDPREQREEPARRASAVMAPQTAEAPFASNVPGNTPIRLRASNPLEQAKTLRCAECGSPNYPTEWYCERCGAELAAL